MTWGNGGGGAQSETYPLIDEGGTGHSCHPTTGYPVGVLGVGYAGSFLPFVRPSGGAFLGTDPAVDITTKTIEVWDNLPTAPGATLLYSGDVDAIPGTVPLAATLWQFDQDNLVYLFTLDPAAVLPLYVTNWHFCVQNSAIFVPPEQPTGSPLTYVTIDLANYELAYSKTFDLQGDVNPYDIQLGQKAGVSYVELGYEDVPMLVKQIVWTWTATPNPLGETLTRGVTLQGMPRTQSSGADTYIRVGGTSGVGHGHIGPG